MKTQRGSKFGWKATHLFVCCLGAFGLAVNAQEFDKSVTDGNSGGGAGFVQRGFGQRFNGPAPQGGAGFAARPSNLGAALLKACDSNQDGGASPAEVNTALVTFFQKADTDTNGALSAIELATELKTIFPAPQLPPGFPPPPEEIKIHNVLATHLMASLDANKDGWLTFKEAVGLVGQNLASWDADGNGWLDAPELAAAFFQLTSPDGSTQAVPGQGIGLRGGANQSFDQAIPAR